MAMIFVQHQTATNQTRFHVNFWVLLGFKLQGIHHLLQNREEQVCPEMEVKHGNVIIRHHTYIIQHPNSSKHVNQDELSKNKFIHQTFKQHIFLNNQPFDMIRSLKQPAK